MKNMKKYIFLIVIFFAVIKLDAQILKTQIVLYKLELDDTNLLKQLDSVLFVEYFCNFKKGYVYSVNIEEKEVNIYSILILYSKPSIVERAINTGIYTYNDRTFIIKEKSNNPIFKVTKEAEIFYYEKLLGPTGYKSNYVEEIISPEEPCGWFLSYTDDQLKVLEVHNVRKSFKRK
jgi:hypothetical protein